MIETRFGRGFFGGVVEGGGRGCDDGKGKYGHGG